MNDVAYPVALVVIPWVLIAAVVALAAFGVSRIIKITKKRKMIAAEAEMFQNAVLGAEQDQKPEDAAEEKTGE